MSRAEYDRLAAADISLLRLALDCGQGAHNELENGVLRSVATVFGESNACSIVSSTTFGPC